MAHYLFQIAYTSEAWAEQLRNPRSFMERATPLIEGLGGSIESAYYSFGEYDVAVIAELPDHVSMAACSLAISAGGAAKTAKTTPLMTLDEGVEAMRKAAGAGYRPPGG